jgi:hypothetical protein
MSNSPLAITISPVKIELPHGRLHGSVQIAVTNTGSQPETVVMSKSALVKPGQHCAITTPPSWVKLTPSAMKLAPGQTGHALVRISAPKGTTGTVDTIAVFTARGQAHGQVTMGASVGAQVIVVASGHQLAPVCGARHTAITHPPVGGFPTAAIGIAGGLAVAFAVVFAVIARRMRRRSVPASPPDTEHIADKYMF